jgi:hypothetical protein
VKVSQLPGDRKYETKLSPPSAGRKSNYLVDSDNWGKRGGGGWKGEHELRREKKKSLQEEL